MHCVVVRLMAKLLPVAVDTAYSLLRLHNKHVVLLALWSLCIRGALRPLAIDLVKE